MQAWPETDGPRIIALAQRNPDTTTALFAIAAHGDEREAHIREVQRYGENPARLLRPTQPPGHRPDLGQDSAASDDAGL